MRARSSALASERRASGHLGRDAAGRLHVDSAARLSGSHILRTGWGVLGLFAVIGESVTDFIYFLFGYGLQALVVPYAVGFVLFVGRIPVFPLVGAIGGYLGRQYFAEKTKPRLRATDQTLAPRKSKENKKNRGKGKEGAGETRRGRPLGSGSSPGTWFRRLHELQR